MAIMRSARQRALATGVGILAVGLALGGCSGATPTASPGGEPVQLNVWTWSADARTALEETVLPAFTKANPDISVTVTQHPNQNYETLLTTALSGSGSPDVVAVRAGILEGMAANESIVPLTDVVSSWEGFTDSVLATVSSRADGRVYAVPQGIQTAQVYYNKKIFADNGIAVPTTWQEFLDACKTLKAAGVAPIVIPGGDVAQTALGAEIFQNPRRGASDFQGRFLKGEATMKDPENVAAFQLMKDIEPYLVDDVTAVTLDAAVTLFATGKAAMFPSGTWQVSTFRGLGADLDYDSFDVPVAPDWPVDKPVTVGYVDGGWALAARSEHPEQAKRLINYFSGVEFAQAYTNAMGTIPARGGVTLDNPLLASMKDRYEQNPSTYLGNAYLRFGTPTGTELVGGVVQRLWLGDLDPAAAAAEYQAGLDAWFDPADFASTVQ